MKVRINRNTGTKNHINTVVNFDKDINTFYKEIIKTTPIDIDFSVISEVCKNDKQHLDIVFSCIACDLINKYIDVHSVAEKYKLETGTDMDSLSVELMFFIFYMEELHTRYNKHLESQMNGSKEINGVLRKYSDKAQCLYTVANGFMAQYNNK